MKVSTAKGLIDREELQLEMNQYEDDNAVYVNTKWWHNGELVRQDAWVNLKQGQATEVIHG